MPNEKDGPEYTNADYYDCSDNPENLSHSTPEEAIEHYLDGYMSPDCDVAAIIADLSPVEVVAWAHKTVDAAQAKSWAMSLAENLNELWRDDEFAHPDGDGDDDPGDNDFVNGVTALIREAVARTHVWACDNVGCREYSEAEVTALMREHVPVWFETDEEERLQPPPSGGG